MAVLMRMNVRMRALHLLCLLPLLGLSSCSFVMGKYAAWKLSSQKKPDNRVGEAKVIGVIELVNPEQNYVLINCEQRLNIPAGTEIIAQNADGSKTKLKVSPERKGNYITADIVEGTPQLRDIVLYQVKAGELPAQNAVPGAPAEGPAVPLTPVMQADVIPPLGTPFQPLTPMKPVTTPVAPAPVVPAPVPSSPPPPKPATEGPAADPGKLPPVVR